MAGEPVPALRLPPLEREALIALRRDLHRHPELAFAETRTAGVVEAALRDLGLGPERLAGTGVVALIEGARPGRTVLLRADMDALPIQEDSAHPHASTQPGAMHACGHDGHTAMLVAAARRLAAVRADLAGCVLLVFQPAEEVGQGARAMIDAGLLERYRPDVAFGMHLWSSAPAGLCSVLPGPVMAAADHLALRVLGRGGHGAMPHQARDPVLAAAQMIVALQAVVARQISPLESAVVTIGRVQGGSAHNIIPAEVRLEGTLRSFGDDVRRALLAAVRRTIEGTAQAADVRAELTITPDVPAVVNDPATSRAVAAVVGQVEGLRLADPGWRIGASEDMAEYLTRVPGAFLFLGAGNPDKGIDAPHHHPRFDVDEVVLAPGAELLARVAWRLAGPEGAA